MIRLVSTILVVILVVFLAACTPQWNEPVFKSQTATPKWLAGLWVDRSGDYVPRLQARGNGFEVLAIGKEQVFLSSAFVTTKNDDLFINVRLDGKYLSTGPIGDPDEVPPPGSAPGYIVFYIDRISDDDVKFTEIDYDKLFADLEGNRRVGTDLCRKVPLFARELQ
jgi:hypothetical protein